MTLDFYKPRWRLSNIYIMRNLCLSSMIWTILNAKLTVQLCAPSHGDSHRRTLCPTTQRLTATHNDPQRLTGRLTGRLTILTSHHGGWHTTPSASLDSSLPRLQLAPNWSNQTCDLIQPVTSLQAIPTTFDPI